MGRKPGMLEEAVHQAFGTQPVFCAVLRNEPNIAQALKNFRVICLAAMGPRLGYAAREDLIEFIAEKAFLVYLGLKDRESSSGGVEALVIKFIPTVVALKEVVGGSSRQRQ